MNRQELSEYVKNQAMTADANVSVLVKDVSSGEVLAQVDSGRKVVSASTIKTPIMLTALEQVRQGRLKLDQNIPVRKQDILIDSMVFEYGPKEMSLRELIFWMIVNSDNTATNVLIDLLSMEEINRYSSAVLGLTATEVQRKMLDWKAIESGRNNYTSAQDQNRVFEAILNRTILEPDLCDLALNTLKSNRDYKVALRYVGAPCSVAHKTGGLDHLVHDTGLFFLPGGKAYFFGFFVTEDVQDKGSQLIGRMNRAVVDYYSGI